MHVDAMELSCLLEQDLLRAGWNGEVSPYPGQPTEQFAMAHQYAALTKKYLQGTLVNNNVPGNVKALELFMKVNDACSNWRLDTSGCTTLEAIAIGEMRVFIDRFFFPEWESSQEVYRDFILSGQRISARFGVGNGSNIGAGETDFYSKFSLSDMSTTDPGLYKLYVEGIRHDPKWAGMESIRHKRRGVRVVSGSRLSFVPKTAVISRTICTEPILNMIFQKGIAACMEERLVEVFGIDLKKQPNHNRQLARIGSETGRFGTIDLSSASDSISINLCKEILPERAYDLLMRVRSPVTTLPGGRTMELHMISSMGNAFTFPLQTMVFAAIVCGCYRAYGIPIIHPRRNTLGNYAVFGDDIIVVEKAYGLTCRLLSLFGFSVNTDKSFNTGTFRESCGRDFYNGRNVRGVYLKTLRDMSDCYSAINRLNRWSAEHGIPLPSLVGALSKRCRFLPIPYDESDDAGIKVPESMVLSAKLNHLGARIYKYAHLLDRRVTLDGKSEVDLPNWYENPDGLLVSFLQGGIRDRSIVLRSFRRKAVVRRRYSSSWDWIAPARGANCEFVSNWKVLTPANLGHKG